MVAVSSRVGGLLIDDDRAAGRFRVHRSAFTSPEVFEQERDLLDRCWLYVGHDSEVANPGDFVRRVVAGRPLLMARDDDGEVNVLLNSCPHRGAMVCRQDQGHTGRFTCFYHGWSFDTRGALVGIPGADAYCDGFDPAERSMVRPAQVAVYRGFRFANFSGDAEPLVDYLAGARDFLDLVVDQAEGDMRIVPGVNRYAIGANWKLLVENSMDTYHRPLHQTYFQYLADSNPAPPVATGTTGDPTAERNHRIDLGNGHTVIQQDAPYGRPIAKWHPLFGDESKEEIAAARRRLVDQFGEERARIMAETTRNLLIFPNLFLNDITGITVRYIEPLAPGQMEVTAWQLAPVGETPVQLRRRFDSYASFVGPAGFGTPDDIEALESCQRGFATVRELPYSDVSRGMGRKQQIRDELQMRVFWRAWLARLEGRPVPPPDDSVEVP